MGQRIIRANWTSGCWNNWTNPVNHAYYGTIVSDTGAVFGKKIVSATLKVVGFARGSTKGYITLNIGYNTTSTIPLATTGRSMSGSYYDWSNYGDTHTFALSSLSDSLLTSSVSSIILRNTEGTLNIRSDSNYHYVILTINYEDPISLSSPTITSHSRITNAESFILFWQASSASGGSGDVTYRVRMYDTATDSWLMVASPTTNTYAIITAPGYNEDYKYIVTAYYNNESIQAMSAEYTINLTSPTLTFSSKNITITPSSGESVTISWNEAELKYASGTIHYQINFDNLDRISTTVEDVLINTFSTTTLKNLGLIDGKTYTISILAWTQTDTTNTYLSATSYSGTFTFTAGNTVGYYVNGTWQECTVYYYDGSEWVECIPYYYDNGWQEINTKIE